MNRTVVFLNSGIQFDAYIQLALESSGWEAARRYRQNVLHDVESWAEPFCLPVESIGRCSISGLHEGLCESR